MKNIIFIAPPAAGKGTQSTLVSETYNIPHISTGDLLREESNKETVLGKKLKDIIAKGNLVSDDIITELLENRIIQNDCKNGYILDGYPRNINQAIIYNDLLSKLHYDKGIVIFLDIDKEIALNRTVSRVVCPKCGASYNLFLEELKPKEENICDRCHHKLEKRLDDTKEVFINRFETYLNNTKELITYYNNLGLLHRINVGTKSVEEIFREVKEAIND